MRVKGPNTKIQIPRRLQTSSSNALAGWRRWNLSLELHWKLVLCDLATIDH